MTLAVKRFHRLLPIACVSLAVTNLADIIDCTIAGRILGETALGAIQLVWPIVEFIFFLGTMIASGTSSRYFVALGEFGRDRATQAFSSGMVAALGCGLLAAASLVVGRDAFFAFFGIGGETVGFVIPYWRWFVFQVALTPINIMMATMVSADGNTRTAGFAFVAEFVVNVVSSYFLCHAMGTAGCALGTVLGTVSGLAVLFSHFRNPKNSLAFTRRISLREMSAECQMGFSSSSAVLFTAVLFLLMNKMLIGTFGDQALAVMAVISLSCNMMMFLYGIPNAVQPVVCLYFGDGSSDVVRKVMGNAILVAAVAGAALSLALSVFSAFPGWIVGVTSPELTALSSQAVRTIAWSFAFTGIGTLLINYYQFTDHIRDALTLVVMQELVLPAAGCIVGMKAFGYSGFLIGYSLAPVLAILVMYVMLCVRQRRLADILQLPADCDAVSRWDITVGDQAACEVARQVHERLEAAGEPVKMLVRADMIVEDSLMLIKGHNPGRSVLAEITLDLRRGVRLTFSDDGTVPPDAHSEEDWFRAQTLGAVMQTVADRNAALAAGVNRSAYVL